MSKAILKKNGIDYPLLVMPEHYPADRVYLGGDPTKNVQDKCARKADLTNLDLTGTTNTTGSTIPAGTYFYLNGVLVRAKTDIASGATFTLNTNYVIKTVGNALENINGEIVEAISKIDGRAAGTYIGTYISISDSRFGIYVPYDVKNKGVPTRFTDLNLSYVAYYNENIRVIVSQLNGIIITSDNLPQNANFIGRTATIVILHEN